jgi:predicted SnoaL-like aldol condensation-catalyzing enzyme
VDQGHNKVLILLAAYAVFVLVVAEGSFGDRPSSYYDFYRIQNGKIAEHWDTIEPIPPRAEWKNSNGKFGFS